MNPSEMKGSETLRSGQTQERIAFDTILRNFMCSTHWWSVFACFDLENLKATSTNIAARLDLELSETEEALNGLCAMGYLRKEGDTYFQVPGQEFLRFNYEALSRDELAEQHSLVSQQILNDLANGGKMAVDHRCFATNDEIMMELYQDIISAFGKAFQKSQNAKNCHRVIKSSITLVDVLKKNHRGNDS